ncbi:MAG TPA: sugar ABC transporter substrate-binding protein [Armatimonadota bacterium]|nr:sugar ABC transporter substrate-binding protein [Armatimonadota bacterium]
MGVCECGSRTILSSIKYLVSSILLVSLLSGCAKSDKPEVVHLRLMMWGKQDELGFYNESLKVFYRDHPNIRVSVELIPWSHVFDKLLISTAGGRTPDVSRVDSTYFTPCAAKGVLECLDQYIENDPTFNIGDFYEEAVEGWGMYDGKIYGLPSDIDIYAMYYNKTMFDKYHVPYPDATWDWNKFLWAAKQLTKDLDGDGNLEQWGCVPDTWWQDYVWQNGGDIVTKDNKQCMLDQPEAYEALQWMADLRGKYRVAPTPANMADIGPQKLFTNGQIGMIISGSWAAPLIWDKEITNFEYDAAPIPMGKRRAAFMGGAAFGIMSRSKHKKEAWELVKFMTSPTFQGYYARTQQIIPSRRSVAESGAYLYLKDKPANKQAFIDAIKYGCVVPNIECSREMNDIINNEIVMATLGKQSAKDVCLRVTPIVDDLLRYNRPHRRLDEGGR